MTLTVNVDGQQAQTTISYDVNQLTGDVSSCDAQLIATGMSQSQE